MIILYIQKYYHDSVRSRCGFVNMGVHWFLFKGYFIGYLPRIGYLPLIRGCLLTVNDYLFTVNGCNHK